MSGVKFRSGIFLPPQHSNDEDPTQAIHRDLQLIEWLDRLGFEEAWIGEHHSGGFEIIYSPELFIAAAAERTKRIRLGTGVVSLPYHNPLTVAGRIVQLDHMTMGRVMFGVGPGALEVDAQMLGIDSKMSRDRMTEALEVILQLFRGETVTKTTDWFSLNEASLHVLPFSHPHPEVAVASSKTPTGGALAGRLGLGLICVAASATEGFDALATNWKLANDVAAEHGNVMDRNRLRLVAPLHIAETREQAYENVKFGLEKWLNYLMTILPGNRARMAGLDPIDIVTNIRGGVIGTPDDAIALIERLREKQGDFGCFLHMAHNWADWEQTKRSYELYARYVVPHLRGANRSRRASFQRFVDATDEVKAAQENILQRSFAKYNAERDAKEKLKAAMPNA
jgi:limonene 1,2-monooxygenase